MTWTQVDDALQKHSQFILIHFHYFTAKAETARLEVERKRLLQDVDNLNAQLQAAERLAAQTQQDFQLERNNSDIKQK